MKVLGRPMHRWWLLFGPKLDPDPYRRYWTRWGVRRAFRQQQRFFGPHVAYGHVNCGDAYFS